MEYSKIFKPETLAKLNKKSSDNLKKLMGDKTLTQKMLRSVELLSEINEAEKPYRDLLESLAIDMVKEIYPIINDENINIDAKIVDMSQVGQELDEVKITQPLFTFYIKDDNSRKKFRELSIKNKWINYTGDMAYDFYYPNNSNLFVKNGVVFNKKYHNIDTIPNDTPIEDEYINESISPESRRRIINGITQGAALRGSFAFYMFKEYLDQIDETLLDKYKEIMEDTFGIYDDENMIALALSLLSQGVKTGGGSSKVIINEIKINDPNLPKENKYYDVKMWFSGKDLETNPSLKKLWEPANRTKLGEEGEYWSKNWKFDNKNHVWFDDFKNKIPFDHKPHEYRLSKKNQDNIWNNLKESQSSNITIRARAINFPMLVHEIIKGLYELVSLQGFKGNKEQNQDTVSKVDKLENEPHDLKYGKYIYDALNQIFSESKYNDPRIREYFFTEIYKLEDKEFIEFIENALNDELTNEQKQWVNDTLKEISDDLKSDDYDSTGIDEIKLEKPLMFKPGEYIKNGNTKLKLSTDSNKFHKVENGKDLYLIDDPKTGERFYIDSSLIKKIKK